MKDVLYPLRRLHGIMYERRKKYEKRKQYIKEFHKNPKTVFLVYTPEHGNMGDHAIVIAEQELLQTIGVNYIEITARQIYEMRKNNELYFMNGYPILITGGGNLGTLWMDIELVERDIIIQNPKSTIMILPNTIYYDDSTRGREEFEKSKDIYNNHKRLHLYAREKKSYSVMINAYKNVKLVPDMALYLNQCKNGVERYGCLLCLRNDCEKTRTKKEDDFIYQQTIELFGKAVTTTDMVVSHSVSVEQRKEELEKKFDQFRKSELVVTDRLHGMIFAAITGTPCVVIDSKSPKVRGCYEWIKDLDYIRFADDASKITEEYYRIPKNEHRYNNEHLMSFYQELGNDILHTTIGGKCRCR